MTRTTIQLLSITLVFALITSGSALGQSPPDAEVPEEVNVDHPTCIDHRGAPAGTGAITLLDLGDKTDGPRMLIEIVSGAKAPDCSLGPILSCDQFKDPDAIILTQTSLLCANTAAASTDLCKINIQIDFLQTAQASKCNVPEVGVPPIPDECSVLSTTPILCDEGPSTDVCDYAPETPVWCRDLGPLPDECSLVPTLPYVCTGGPSTNPCDYVDCEDIGNLPDECILVPSLPGCGGPIETDPCEYVSLPNCGGGIDTNPCTYVPSAPGCDGSGIDTDPCTYAPGAPTCDGSGIDRCELLPASCGVGPIGPLPDLLPDCIDYLIHLDVKPFDSRQAATPECKIEPISTDPCDYYANGPTCGEKPEPCDFVTPQWETDKDHACGVGLPRDACSLLNIPDGGGSLPCGIVGPEPCDFVTPQWETDKDHACGVGLPRDACSLLNIPDGGGELPCGIVGPDPCDFTPPPPEDPMHEAAMPCGMGIPHPCGITGAVPGACGPLPPACAEGIGAGDVCIDLIPDCPQEAGTVCGVSYRAILTQVYEVAGSLVPVVVGIYENVYEDLDEDGMGDEWERRVAGTVEYLYDRLDDIDQDGLSNGDEFRWNTDPFEPDTDFDGVTDGPEAAYWDRSNDGTAKEEKQDAQDAFAQAQLAVQHPDSKRDDDSDGTPSILDPDSDNDLLKDGEEYHATFGHRTLLEARDTDSDGLTDYQEVRHTATVATSTPDGGYGTNPLNADTDADGIQDGAEVLYWGAAWNVNHDCDARSNNLRDPDADGDRLPDGPELYEHDSDPAETDTDGDGMDDAFEVRKGLLVSDARDAALDADGDGLSNLFEYGFLMPAGYSVCSEGPYWWGLDPLRADMDDDGRTDRNEVFGDQNVYLTEHYVGWVGSTNAKKEDTDRDGLTDTVEVTVYGTDPNNWDTDADGLSDSSELRHGTDPLDADSDNDGMLDGDEVDAGVDPNNPDSDGDGAPDGSDSNPRAEEIEPEYPGGGESFLVFREDGYIDVIIDGLNEDDNGPAMNEEGEAEIVGIVANVELTAERDGVTLPDTLRMRYDLERGDDGAWGARMAVPTGVDRITQEYVQVIVVDSDGDAWSFDGTFGNILNGPEWSDLSEEEREAGGWSEDTGLRHVAPPEAEASGTSSTSATSLGIGAVEEPQVWVYRLRPDLGFQPHLVEGVTSGVFTAESPFTYVDPEEEPEVYLQASKAGNWFRKAKNWVVAVPGKVDQWFDGSFDYSNTALKYASAQAGSFIFGSESASANGRMLGDIVSGFLLWGDLRDCIRYTYTSSTSDQEVEAMVDAVIAALSCSGFLADIAQLSGPPGIAANAALVTLKSVAKSIRHVEPKLVLQFGTMVKGIRTADDAFAVKDFAVFLGKNVMDPSTLKVTAKGLRVAVHGVGEENFIKLIAASNAPQQFLRNMADMGDEMATLAATRTGQGEAAQVFARFSDAGTDLDAMGKMFRKYRDMGADYAGDMVWDASFVANVDGFASWFRKAKTETNVGPATEAFFASSIHRRGDLVSMNQAYHTTEADVWIKDGPLKIFGEVKTTYRAADLDQLAQQAKFVKADSTASKQIQIFAEGLESGPTVFFNRNGEKIQGIADDGGVSVIFKDQRLETIREYHPRT